ncbi:hypothetical protein HYFRA_00006926 [Hymenoscyphus fraxineus]|uniref:Uncharacterized protein n=1 Tax=Hymenoscyphus fraxineus TaxID=746836 RepID=A0A9N9KQT2_9HELO|nr:hypothetical protein HYFRA_00006926 [Hymenoscyphus fraxineus]
MMHVAEGSGYWTSNKPTPRSRRSQGSNKKKNTEGKATGEYAHTGPVEIKSAQKVISQRQNEWCRSYDPRIDPHCFTDGGDEREQSMPTQVNNSTQASMTYKNPETEDALWETIDSTRFTQDNETSSPSMTSVVPSLLSTSPFRTGSEAKRLTRFTKELELHYTAVQSLPKQSLLFSPSATTVSADTVGPLVPFHAEFQSAGLAVTSKEQRRLPGQKPNTYNKNSDCLSTVADRRPVQCYGHDGQRSFASGTTGTTVLGFTPPHEKTYGRSGQSRARGSSTGSAFTAVGFTPPHEKMATAPKALPTSAVRLPRLWLDNEEKSPKAPLSPAKVSVASAIKYQEPGGTYQAPPTEYVPRPSTDKRSNYVKDNTAPSERDPIQDLGAPRRTVTTQTDPPEVNYRQVATQTTVSDLISYRRDEAKSENQDALTNRAKRSNTFPSKATKCDETCNREDGKAVEIPGWIRSRLPWERKAKSPQTTQEHTTGPKIIYPESQEKTSERPKARPKNRSLDLRPDMTQDGQISSEQQLGTESSKARCAGCGVQIDEDVESMDGQAEPSSSREPLCPQCTPSVYTAYVAPPKRAQYSEARQSEKSTAQDPVLKTAGADKSKSPEKVPEPEDNNEKEHGGIWTHIKNAEHSLADCTKMMPVVDPVKKPSKPRKWSCESTSPDEGGENMEYFLPSNSKAQPQSHRGRTEIKSKHFPPRNQPSGTRHYSSDTKNQRQHHTQVKAGTQKPPSSSIESRGKSHQSNKPSNEQVFHGLQVATAAACDEDLDKWISEINGSGVRHFLADLSKFEPLGVNTLASVARKAAKQRKEQVRVWEKVREERLKNNTNDSQDKEGKQYQARKMENEIDGKADERSGDWLVDDLGVRQR